VKLGLRLPRSGCKRRSWGVQFGAVSWPSLEEPPTRERETARGQVDTVMKRGDIAPGKEGDTCEGTKGIHTSYMCIRRTLSRALKYRTRESDSQSAPLFVLPVRYGTPHVTDRLPLRPSHFAFFDFPPSFPSPTLRSQNALLDWVFFDSLPLWANLLLSTLLLNVPLL
jgi:hypothetical protein